MSIMRKHFIPIYEQVKRYLEEEIISGVKKPNEQLPPEPELALQYNISRKTLRQALSELAKEGFLVRRRGKGTFVTDIKKILPEKHKFVNNSLGILVPSITYFFPEVVRGIEDVAKRNGYIITLCNTDDDPNKEREYLDNLMSWEHTTNFIIALSKYENDFSVYTELRKKGAKVVFIDRYFEELGKEVDYIIQDNQEGMKRAVSYLNELGHKKILFIAKTQGDEKDYILTERLNGFEKALDIYRFGANRMQSAIKVVSSFSERVTRQSLKDFLRETSFTAIVALSDSDAREIVDIIAEIGLRIPEDVSLIGYDDSATGRFFNPSLTTMSVPKYEMGKEAAKFLLEWVKKGTKKNGPFQKALKPKLIVRGTTKKLYKEQLVGIR